METGAGLVKARGGLRRAVQMLQRGGARLLDLIYPPGCLACDEPVATAGALCPACFAALRPITAPLCPRLGIPFAASLGPDALSAEAIADPPPFDRSRSAVVYGAVARRVVSRLKYGDRPELAPFCARLMALAGREVLTAPAVLVPVPLHYWRHLGRRYNQSTELAMALSRLTGLAVDTRLVRRARATRRQVGLTAQARARNVAGAFAVDPVAATRHAQGRVVLVDDVITTGATMGALTRALQRAGVAHVDVVSFARVVVGQGDPI